MKFTQPLNSHICWLALLGGFSQHFSVSSARCVR